MSKYQIFSSPTLLSHLTKQLHQRWCAITKEDNIYYLYSSDIEYFCSSIGSKSKKRFDGLLSVFNMPLSNSKAPINDEIIYADRLLTILNGIIKLKYKEGNGLSRFTISPSSATLGVIKRQQGFETTKTVGIRLHLARHPKEFQDADKQPPKMKNIWRAARRDPSIARAFYYFGMPSNSLNLRKTIEEIAADTYQKKTPKDKLNNTAWISVQKWTEPEILASRMLDVWNYLHKSSLSGDESLHAEGQSKLQQATPPNPPLTTTDVVEVVHVILMKWISTKVK